MEDKLNLTNLTQEQTKYRAKVEQDPEDDHSWYMLAQVYQRKRRLDDAETSYKRAIALTGRPEYHLKLGELYFNGRQYGPALHHLLETSKLADDSWNHRPLVDELIERIYSRDSC